AEGHDDPLRARHRRRRHTPRRGRDDLQPFGRHADSRRRPAHRHRPRRIARRPRHARARDEKMNGLRPDKIERVVVRGANWVGDAVMTVPALRELRRVLPGAHITLATRAWAEGIFEGADFLDEIIAVEEAKGAARSVWR